MVKRLLVLTIVMAMSVVANAGDWGDWTLWGLTGDGADHTANIRIGNVKDRVEIGGTVAWWTMRPNWGPEIDAAGIYGIFHMDEIIQVIDPVPNNLWDDFVQAFIGRPYVGIEALMPTQGAQRTPKVNWLAGTLLSTSDDFKRSLVIEYASGQGVASDAEKILKVGLRIRF